jgi:hypothetical protein
MALAGTAREVCPKRTVAILSEVIISVGNKTGEAPVVLLSCRARLPFLYSSVGLLLSSLTSPFII